MELIDYGLDTIPKILNASVNEFKKIDGIQEKMARKLFLNIQKGVKSVKLPILMASSDSFHGGLGKRKLTALVKEYPDILEWKSNKKQIIELVEEVDGFSTISATHVATGLPKFKQFLKTVQPPIIIGEAESIKVPKKLIKFKDKKLVFTGFRNKEWIELLEAVGANITSTVSKNTDFVSHEKL